MDEVFEELCNDNIKYLIEKAREHPEYPLEKLQKEAIAIFGIAEDIFKYKYKKNKDTTKF